MTPQVQVAIYMPYDMVGWIDKRATEEHSDRSKVVRAIVAQAMHEASMREGGDGAPGRKRRVKGHSGAAARTR
jgi:metal-responsive CopG/Arc/MetJ family transcriptional regulator